MAAYEHALAVAPNHDIVRVNLAVALSERGSVVKLQGERGDLLGWVQAGSVRPGGAHPGWRLGPAWLAVGGVGWCQLAEHAPPYLGYLALTLAPQIPRSRPPLSSHPGKQEEAVALYERALGLYPLHGESMYNLGVAAMEAGQMHRAIFMYESAVRVLPACAEAHNNLGVVYRWAMGEEDCPAEREGKGCSVRRNQGRAVTLQGQECPGGLVSYDTQSTWGRQLDHCRPYL